MNCKIFIYTHKEFTPICTDTDTTNYSILSEINLKLDYTFPIYDVRTCDNIYHKGRSYSELKGIYWVWKNLKDQLPKYVGFCHYRRYFEEPDLGQYNVDCIICKECYYLYNKEVSVIDYFNYWHNAEDLTFCLNYITNKDYSYKPYIDKYLRQSNILGGYCMFVMERENFLSMCEWLFDIFDVYDKYHNTYSEQDYVQYILNNSSLYHLSKTSTDNNQLMTQSRYIGYIGERLIYLWIVKNLKNIYNGRYIQTD